MSGVITGFSTIVVVIAVGYFAARAGVVPGDGDRFLARIMFTIAMPALLFTTLLQADPRQVFSPLLLGILISTVVMAGIYILLARLRGRAPTGELVIGGLASCYVNASNLGIPIAAYVLGDTSYVAPVLLVQLLFLAPISLTILDVNNSARSRSWTRPLRNPIILGSGLGLAVGATPWQLPALILEPIGLLADAAVPLALLTYGISLWGSGGFRGIHPTWNLGVVTALKTLVHPLFAWALGHLVLDLAPADLFALVVISALPTAQNVYVYALQYHTSLQLARSAILVTTTASIGTVMVIAGLLG